MDSLLLHYYARRAQEYERIYERPERQADLAALDKLLRSLLVDRDVLELACGTGYWTARVAPVVRSVLATDLTPEVLAIARDKSYPPGQVRFAEADAYAPETVPGRFSAVMAGFWWSHVPRQRLPVFLRHVRDRAGTTCRVVFFDNRFVSGSSTPISRTDEHGNTYQERTLADGTRHEVLKNFPSRAELFDIVAPDARDVTYTELHYYWCLSYTVRPER